MAGSFGNQLETDLLNLEFRGTTFATPTTFFIALSSADPTDSATGLSEINPTSERATIQSTGTDWTAPSASTSGQQIANAVEITFPQASSDWGDAAYFAIFNTSIGTAQAQLVAHSSLNTTKTISSGDTAKFSTGQLTIALD